MFTSWFSPRRPTVCTRIIRMPILAWTRLTKKSEITSILWFSHQLATSRPWRSATSSKICHSTCTFSKRSARTNHQFTSPWLKVNSPSCHASCQLQSLRSRGKRGSNFRVQHWSNSKSIVRDPRKTLRKALKRSDNASESHHWIWLNSHHARKRLLQQRSRITAWRLSSI